MAWNNRPREEGPGNFITRRARAWVFAKNGWVPDSQVDAQQYSTNAEKTTYRRTNRVDDGLVCEWWFDEGEGDRIYDRTLGTTQSNLRWIYNPGLGFDGEWSQDASLDDRNYLNLSAGGAARNSGSLEPLSEIKRSHEATVEAWIKPTAAAGLATSGPGRVFLLGPIDNGYVDQCLMLGHGTWTGNSAHAATAFSARVKVDDTVHSLWSNDGVATTGLHHLALTCKYIGNNQAKAVFYVDGVEVDSKTIATDGSGIFEDWDNTSRMVMGADRDGAKQAPGGYFLGAIYEKALNAAEIAQNFADGVVAYSGGYKKGTRATLGDAETSLKAGEADKFEVSLSGGTHLDKITITLAASSDDANLTYGQEFTLTPSTVDILKGATTASVSLSCDVTTSADHVVHVYVDSVSNNGGTTVMVNPLNDAYDSFDTSVISKAQKPELKISYDQNPTIMPTTSQAAVGVFTVSKTRDYDEQIEFTFDGSADVNNVADYYFLSGGAPGVFSAPFQPEPGVNCGHNNDYLINTLGYNGGVAPTLTAYTGPMNITVDGTTIQDKIITGTLNINADNVTLKNCLITNSGSSPGSWPPYTLNAWGGVTGLLVEDCTISKAKSSCALLDNGQTMRRCHLEDTAGDLLKSKKNLNGIPELPCLVESCHFSKMGYKDYDDDAHADAWQLAGAGGHLICRWNYFNIPGYNATPPNRVHSASIIWLNKGKTSLGGGEYELEYGYDCGKLIIDSNWFYGGSNAICLGATYGDMTDTYVINNKFYGTVDDYDIVTGTEVGMPWFQNLIAEGENAPYVCDTKCFNNRLYDGTLAYRSGAGPNNPSVSLIDNVASAPSIPFYDSPVGNTVDLSDGITLSIGPDELSRVVTVYSQATDSQGVFVDGDKIKGFLQSGSILTGDDAGTSLSVCSTLSTLDVEFDDAGILRSGAGGSPVKSHTYILTTQEDDRGRSILERIRVNTYSTAEALDDTTIMSRVEAPPLGGETSATTGPRISVTDHPRKSDAFFVDPGSGNSTNKIEVPPGGLIVSGYLFNFVKVRTTNPIRFVDCQFSGYTDWHEGSPTQSYLVWDNNQGGGNINKKLDFEYCSFEGGEKMVITNFRGMHKCRFNNTTHDYIRFRDGNYRITNCWFGPYRNAVDSALNGNNGMYSPDQGLDPHSDDAQIYKTTHDIIHFGGCTFDSRTHEWEDGTTNPDHYLGSNPDKIFQYDDKDIGDGVKARLDVLLFTDCILRGGGYYMFSMQAVEGIDPTSETQPCTIKFKNCKFGSGTKSGLFENIGAGHTKEDLGGNVWLDTGTPGIRLPQEAIDAGTTTDLGRNNLPISYYIRGIDRVTFHKPGLNESGRTEWTKRGIGWG